MNDAAKEAIAYADAYLSNAGLPTYTAALEMLAALRLEAIHYANTKNGEQFLRNKADQAAELIAQAR